MVRLCRLKIEDAFGDRSISVYSALFGRSIVARLRLAFLSFVLASVAIFFLIWKQMDQLSVVESFIFETALPSLKLDQEIDRHITNIILYASTMVSDIPQDEVDRLYAKLKSETNSLSDLLDNDVRLSIRTSDISAIKTTISEMESSTNALFRVVSQRSQLLSDSGWLLDKLKDMESNFSLASEIEYLNIWDLLISSARLPRIDQVQFVENVARIATFVEVEAQIFELFVLVERLPESVSEEDVRILENRLDFILQKSAQSILTRQPSESLLSLSEMMGDLKEITSGASGLVASTLQLIELETRRFHPCSDTCRK